MATVNKPYYSVAVTTIGGYTHTFADTASMKIGKSAWSALQGAIDIKIDDGTNVYFIPFHAVDRAILTVTATEETKPVDVNCPEG